MLRGEEHNTVVVVDGEQQKDVVLDMDNNHYGNTNSRDNMDEVKGNVPGDTTDSGQGESDYLTRKWEDILRAAHNFEEGKLRNYFFRIYLNLLQMAENFSSV